MAVKLPPNVVAFDPLMIFVRIELLGLAVFVANLLKELENVDWWVGVEKTSIGLRIHGRPGDANQKTLYRMPRWLVSK